MKLPYDKINLQKLKALIPILELFVLAGVAYLVLAPTWPAFRYRLSTETTADSSWEQLEQEVVTAQAQVVKTTSQLATQQGPRSANRLIISKIKVNAPIVEGQDETTLEFGAWRWPHSATPDKVGNVVITGHRFKYLPPNNTTFYNLDKLSLGDVIGLVWNKKAYYYKVIETKIVAPEDVSIQAQTNEARLTLYTCHPLWSQKKRLVVVAELVVFPETATATSTANQATSSQP